MRKRLNRAVAVFYGCLFVLMGLCAVCGMMAHMGQAAILTYDYKPTGALAVAEFREKNAWVKFAYTVNDKDYTSEESIWFFSHQDLFEPKMIEVYYSPSHPEIASLDRPSVPRLLWTMAKDCILLAVLLILCLVGAVGMLAEGAKATALLDERQRQKKIKADKVGGIASDLSE